MNLWIALPLLLTVVFLCGALAWLMWLMTRQNEKWMRLFCDKLGTNPSIMEAKSLLPADEKAPLKPDTRRRISVPLPGAGLFRSNGGIKQ